MSNPLNNILNPKSVALIGASRNPTSFSYTYLSIMKNYGYRGNIYPINPRADAILGLKCYPSILDVPDEIDLAVVVTARQIAGASVEECVEKGVKGIMLLTGGFAELDDAGRAAQDEFVRQAKGKGIRVIGPNTLGFFSTPAKFDGLLSGYIREGSIGLVGQSGNLTRSLAFPGIKRGLGFRYIIGLGNQADVQFHEVIRFLREDDNVNAVGLHIEGVNDGRKFLDEVAETTKLKPVVVMKTGRTEQGARVISSHTASLAGQDEIFEAAFKQCGALRVESAVEFSSLLLALSHGKLPKGNRVGILSEGGGDCALTADACTLKGLDLPTLSPKHQERLKGIVPEIGQVTNPVDLAMWEKIPEVAEIMLEGDEIDGLIVVGGFAGWDFLNPNVAPEVEASAEKIAALIAKTDKPLLIYTYYSYADSKSFETLRENRVPLFMDHHDAVNTMAGLVQHTRYKATKAERRFSNSNATQPAAGKSRTKPLLEHQANRLLEAAGLPFPAYQHVTTAREAIDAAEEIGYPVVLKIISRDVLHKSEVGCVKLGLHTPEAVACAFDEVIANARTFKCDARITGALLSKMGEDDGVEVIIGGLNDPTFGPTLMFGLGGVYVEVMRDVSFRVCPITPDDADQMIRELDGFPLLTGARGGKPVHLESLRAALLNVSAFLMENPRIAQLDLNPVKVHERGLSVLDARLIQYSD